MNNINATTTSSESQQTTPAGTVPFSANEIEFLELESYPPNFVKLFQELVSTWMDKVRDDCYIPFEESHSVVANLSTHQIFVVASELLLHFTLGKTQATAIIGNSLNDKSKKLVYAMVFSYLMVSEGSGHIDYEIDTDEPTPLPPRIIVKDGLESQLKLLDKIAKENVKEVYQLGKKAERQRQKAVQQPEKQEAIIKEVQQQLTREAQKSQINALVETVFELMDEEEDEAKEIQDELNEEGDAEEDEDDDGDEYRYCYRRLIIAAMKEISSFPRYTDISYASRDFDAFKKRLAMLDGHYVKMPAWFRTLLYKCIDYHDAKLYNISTTLGNNLTMEFMTTYSPLAVEKAQVVIFMLTRYTSYPYFVPSSAKDVHEMSKYDPVFAFLLLWHQHMASRNYNSPLDRIQAMMQIPIEKLNMGELQFLNRTPLQDRTSKITDYLPCCSQCFKKASAKFKLKRCARCNLVYYCDVDCQKKHFPKHKTECMAWASMK